jgi:hypothetical protein
MNGFDLSTCPLLTATDLGVLLRNADLAKRCIYHGWISSCANTGEVKGKRLYKRKDVDTLLSKIENGQVPPPLPRKCNSSN